MTLAVLPWKLHWENALLWGSASSAFDSSSNRQYRAMAGMQHLLLVRIRIHTGADGVEKGFVDDDIRLLP